MAEGQGGLPRCWGGAGRKLASPELRPPPSPGPAGDQLSRVGVTCPSHTAGPELGFRPSCPSPQAELLLSPAPRVCPQPPAHTRSVGLEFCLGLSSSKADRASGEREQASPCPVLPAKPASPLYQFQQAAFSLLGWGSPAPSVRQARSSHTPSASPPSLAPSRHGVGEKRRRKELCQAQAGTTAVPFPASSQPLLPLSVPHRKLLTPSDNTQHHAHFHKYKANRVGQRGRQSGGGTAPTSLELPSPPPTPSVSRSNLRSPPALKIAQLPPQFPWQQAFGLGMLSGL